MVDQRFLDALSSQFGGTSIKSFCFALRFIVNMVALCSSHECIRTHTHIHLCTQGHRNAYTAGILSENAVNKTLNNMPEDGDGEGDALELSPRDPEGFETDDVHVTV